MKTSELIGKPLDWVVAKAEGKAFTVDATLRLYPVLVLAGEEDQVDDFYGGYRPSTNWTQGGPIIEREGIATRQHLSPDDHLFHGEWEADSCNYRFQGRGPSPLDRSHALFRRQ